MVPETFSDSLATALGLLIVTQLGLRIGLLARQARHVRANRDAVPAAFANRVSSEAHRKAADYTAALAGLAMAVALIEAASLLGWTLMGGLQALNAGLRNLLLEPTSASGHAGSVLAYQVALLVSVSIIGTLVELPLDIVRHFVVERRFGFNRMTPGLYAADLARNLVISVAIGVPLAALILLVMGHAGTLWWLWAFAALAGLQCLLMVVYPTWIAPLFNRFTPLADPALEARVKALMTRCGFEARGLLVMDGSRRSAHANAYFTGLGRSKRVVFFDTLLSRLSPPEVEAVLAHELGHFRRRHILQRLVLSLLSMLGLLALLGWLSQQPAFYTGLGVQPNLGAPNDALALALFMLVLPLVTFFLGPIGAWWSRRHEYEADAYAAEQADAQALGAALVKLHEDNAATLTPDPWYVRFHYSHPPALQRLQALGLAHA